MDITVFEYGTDELATLGDAKVVYIGPTSYAVRENSELLSVIRLRLDGNSEYIDMMTNIFYDWYDRGAYLSMTTSGSEFEGCFVGDYGINPVRGRLFVTLQTPLSFHEAKEMFSES